VKAVLSGNKSSEAPVGAHDQRRRFRVRGVRKLVLPCLLIVLLGLLAAGCGKSRNKAYSGSVQEFAAALNAICGPAQSQIQALAPKSAAELVTKGPQIKDIINTAVGKIDNLEPPGQVEGAANDFVSKSRDEVKKLDELVDAAKNNDQAKLSQVQSEISALDKATDKDARAIGAQSCVSQS